MICKKTNLKILILTLLVIIGSNILLNFSLNSNNSYSTDFKENVKTSLYWDLTGSPIYIDDTDPSFNWITTESTFPWCSGSGTWVDPYIIENVFIDGEGIDTCIFIKNSEKYFEIRNCTLINSGEWRAPNNYYAGVKLDNVKNGLLENNTLNYHQGRAVALISNSIDNNIIENNLKHNYGGIFIDHSPNNNILRNRLQNTTWSHAICFSTSNNTMVKNNYILESGMINMIARAILSGDSYNSEIRDNTIIDAEGGGINVQGGTDTTIFNNSVSLSYGFIDIIAIYISNSNSNSISNNTLYDNVGHGIYLSNSHGNQIFHNHIALNRYRGISLSNSDSNQIYSNNISQNQEYGLYAYNCFNNTIFSNLFHNNQNPSDPDDGVGIYLNEGQQNFITQNIIHNNEERGILLENSVDNEVIQNTIFNNERGVYASLCNGTMISHNHIYENVYGIWLDYCKESLINLNNISMQSTDGIKLEDSTDNHITNNTANGNGVHASPSSGISLYVSSDNNYLYNNTCLNNRGYGIHVDHSDQNQLISNNVSSNQNSGIYVYGSQRNSIQYNHAEDNEFGIRLRATSLGFTTIENNLTNNYCKLNDHGIYLEQFANNSFISDNHLIDNIIYGIFIDNFNQENILTQNIFLGNSIHARDDGVNSDWSYNGIGNFWDNYTGTDSNDDGIGDTPYIYIFGGAGSEDPYPIYEDGDDIPPTIAILSPELDDFFGSESPFFELIIVESYINSTWYSMNGSVTKFFFSGSNGVIDQAIWDTLLDGTINITFYINDSIGFLDQDSIIIQKDTVLPEISIVAPTLNQVFGSSSPSFDLFIVELNFLQSWYTINNDPFEYYFTSNGVINQTAWNALPEGEIIITFYVEDEAGNLKSEAITVIKDLSTPLIPGYELWILMGILLFSIFTIGLYYKKRYQ